VCGANALRTRRFLVDFIDQHVGPYDLGAVVFVGRGIPTAVSGPDARVLILGTLPGAASIAQGAYYAHPRNAFWRIMTEITGADPALPYDERLRCLVRARVAVWDVCAHAVRPGSLDLNRTGNLGGRVG
jgi:hypothetical protein